MIVDFCLELGLLRGKVVRQAQQVLFKFKSSERKLKVPVQPDATSINSIPSSGGLTVF